MSMLPMVLGLLTCLQTQEARPATPATPPTPAAPQGPAPAAPHLEVAGTKISVYGHIHMDAYWGDARVNHQQFTMWANSQDPTVTPGINDKSNWIDWTPRMSRFGVRATRDSLPSWEGAKVLGLIEFDFQNRATSEAAGTESESRELPRLRHAYLKVSDGAFSALAGQTSDLISPLFPAANYDALMWNSGNLGDRRPQLRLGLEDKVSDGTWNAAMALARTGAIDRKNLDVAQGDPERDGDDSGLPMIQGRLGLASLFEKRFDIGVWGHIGWEELEGEIAGEDSFTTSSVGLDLKIKLMDTLVLSGEIWGGKNLSDLRGGIDQGVNTATGDEIASAGGWVELAWTILPPNLTLSGGVAVDDPKDGDLTAATQRSKNVAPFAVAKVDLGGGFTFGLEWIQWRTDYLNVDEGLANRFTWFAGLAF